MNNSKNIFKLMSLLISLIFIQSKYLIWYKICSKVHLYLNNIFAWIGVVDTNSNPFVDMEKKVYKCKQLGTVNLSKPWKLQINSDSITSLLKAINATLLFGCSFIISSNWWSTAACAACKRETWVTSRHTSYLPVFRQLFFIQSSLTET